MDDAVVSAVVVVVDDDFVGPVDAPRLPVLFQKTLGNPCCPGAAGVFPAFAGTFYSTDGDWDLWNGVGRCEVVAWEVGNFWLPIL